MRTLTAALTAVLVSSFLFPAAGAAVGPAAALLDPDTKIVSQHSVQQYFPFAYCSSDDPALGIVDTDVTSTMSRADEGAMSRFTFRLDAGLGGALESTSLCPTMEFSGLASATWPAEGSVAASSLALDCGATAHLIMWDHPQALVADVYFTDAPASCGVPISGYGAIHLYMGKVQNERSVCTPVVFAGCSGPSTYTYPDYFCGGAPMENHRLDVAGFTILAYSEMCHPGTDYERQSYFGDGIGIIGVATTDDSCSIRVLDFFGGFEPVACPAGDDVIRSHPWVGVFEALP